MSTLTQGQTLAASRAPLPALLLGAGGLIPFVGLALWAAGSAASSPSALHALTTYAAVILGFVGALHWGYALRADGGDAFATLQYVYSVLPALVGWFALQLPVVTTLRVQAAAFAACFLVDVAFAGHEAPPRWFLRLRAVLSSVAVAALFIASDLG